MPPGTSSAPQNQKYRSIAVVQIRQPLRILVIDDHAPSMFVVRHTLRIRGYTCEGSTTLAEGLAYIRSLRPDVVLYEWNVRSGSGRGFAAQLRAEAARVQATMSVIALSTLDEPEGFQDSEPVDAYLIKPLDIERLVTLMATIVSTSSR